MERGSLTHLTLKGANVRRSGCGVFVVPQPATEGSLALINGKVPEHYDLPLRDDEYYYDHEKVAWPGLADSS